MTTLNAIAERDVAAALAAADPEPGPAELLVAAYVLAGMAMYLAWARMWRWW